MPQSLHKQALRLGISYKKWNFLMIRVKDLTRTYGDLTAVDQVSFEVGRGEIVGLLGHNGAGKTTIMKMLTGYLEPTDGRCQGKANRSAQPRNR